MQKVLAAAAVVFLGALTPAAAHEDEDRYQGYGYSDHARYHDELGDAHERAHEEGFYSRRDHRAFHRALRSLHEGYHDDGRYDWRRYE